MFHKRNEWSDREHKQDEAKNAEHRHIQQLTTKRELFPLHVTDAQVNLSGNIKTETFVECEMITVINYTILWKIRSIAYQHCQFIHCLQYNTMLLWSSKWLFYFIALLPVKRLLTDWQKYNCQHFTPVLNPPLLTDKSKQQFLGWNFNSFIDWPWPV